MTIGQKLISLRGDKRREVVAADNGISVSSLAMYETNQRIPRDQVKIRLARYYGVTVGEIFYADYGHET